MFKRLKAVAVAATLGFFALGVSAPANAGEPYWQCVTFARMFSGIQIFGDAVTWWRQAQGRFQTGHAPRTGSVLSFEANGRMSRGHVAVVSEVMTDRVIRVTHANWGGSRGRVEENVTVVDVSDGNDWTAVKVWYNPINDLGTTVYPTNGFIYQQAPVAAEGVQMASAPAHAAGQN